MGSFEQVDINIGNSYIVTSPAPRVVWEAVFKKDANALVTQSPAWLDCICATGNYEDASRLYEISGRGMFILPMVRLKQVPLMLTTLYSPPYSWGMGGLIGDVAIMAEDVKVVVDDLTQLPGLRKLIRPNPLTTAAWNNVRGAGITLLDRQAHILDLRDGFDQIWSKKFDTNTRRNIRKAESGGVIIECDQSGKLVSVFHQLFKQSVERWATHQHEPHWLAHLRAQKRDPITKFEMIAKYMKSSCRIWVAWHNNEPAAAILVLQGANAHYTRGVMNVDIAGPTRANDLLHRYAIEDACQSGCQYYHMGETGKSDSLARFKGRFGAEAVPYVECHIERLPVTQLDAQLRGVVKKLIGFKDV